MSKPAIKPELPRYVGYAEIAEATGIERHTIQRLMKANKFPKPDALPTKGNRWRLSVVQAWLQQRNAEQVAALDAQARTDPSRLKPDEVVGAHRALAVRLAEAQGVKLDPDDIVGFTYRLTDEQRQTITAQAAAASLDFCEMFGRLDAVRALLVAGGLMPVLRPVVNQCLTQMTGVTPSETDEQLRELALDIVLQSKEGVLVGPRGGA